jgi:2-polyprenyl-6-methoxyphenol hydroxylase-like FAD-dependent oxidoreductase
VYGKTPLRPAALELLPAALDAGFTAVIGRGLGMATGLVRFRNRPDQIAGVRLSAAEDYLMWGLTGDRGQFGVHDERLLTMSPAELHALSATLIRSWHPDLRGLHAMADIEETFAVRIRTSPVIRAWQPSRVTVLGDAVHAMSPAGGSGANTALQDAAQLCSALTTAADGDITTAIGQYEHHMRDYGYAAVAASAKAETERGTLRNPLLSWLFRRVARV